MGLRGSAAGAAPATRSRRRSSCSAPPKAGGPAGVRSGAENNSEVGEVPHAGAGKWTAGVGASNVSTGPQDFALVAVLV